MPRMQPSAVCCGTSGDPRKGTRTVQVGDSSKKGNGREEFPAPSLVKLENQQTGIAAGSRTPSSAKDARP